MRKAIATFFALFCATAAYGQFAASIVHAAQDFSQEDGISALTLAFVRAEVLHA
jgi:hypothetical protein